MGIIDACFFSFWLHIVFSIGEVVLAWLWLFLKQFWNISLVLDWWSLWWEKPTVVSDSNFEGAWWSNNESFVLSSWLLLVWYWLVTSTKLCRDVGFLNFLLMNERKRGVKLQNHNIKTLGKSLLPEWPSPPPIILCWCKLIKAAMYSWTEEHIPGYLGVLESVCEPGKKTTKWRSFCS